MNSKSRKGLNLLDILIIIVVAAVIGGGWYLYSQYTAASQLNKHVVEYKVELKGVDQAFVNAVAKGDLLRESVKGNNLGKVADMTSAPASNINTDFLNGKYVEVPVPDKYDMILTIYSEAAMSDRSITVGGLEIKIGQKLFVKGKGYAREGYILNIDIKK